MLGDRKTAVLRGGTPWGFRLAGGGQTPIYIAKVRSRSKAALGGLAAGDNLVSVNGISALQLTLREINDIIDTVRDQLILEVQGATNIRGSRHDSGSSIDTRENSPIRPIQHLITSQTKPMDYNSYPPSRSTPTYSSYNNYPENSNQRFTDSYSRSIPNPLQSIFRTATITTNSPPTPIATARVQQFSYRPSTSNYDTPRSYNDTITSGYASDTNDFRRSSISIRPMNGTSMPSTNIRHVINQAPSPSYNIKSSIGTEQNYYSDSEYVTSGPRYYKITRQINTSRRPSNVVLPIRSITSKAYDQYIPPEPSPPKQQPPPLFDVYRPIPSPVQQEQRHRIFPPKLTFPTPTSTTTIDPEIGAELLKSPLTHKKRYANSSFFQTPYNTYPTIEVQKSMARQIASILEGGDPSQKGSTKFEKQRQRSEKYTFESTDTGTATNYRPLRPLQTNDSFYSNHQQQTYTNSSKIPECIKHSLDEAQYINPLRYVGAPEEFKQMHMQEHVTHTNVPPQVAMSLVADLNQNRDKGAALFQKRKARSDKWIIDENNVKKQSYQPIPNYIGATSKAWGQRAPSWSDSEGPSNSPIRTVTSPSPVSILSPTPVQNGPRFGDFNAKPKGFGTWNGGDSSPRPSIDTRKPLNLNIEPSIREGIAESHTRHPSQPWSPLYNSQPSYPPQTPPIQNHFNYPSENLLSKWKNQDYQYNGYNTQRNYSPSSQNFTDL